MRLFKLRIAVWVLDNVPLRGPFAILAPWLFGYIINSRPHKVTPRKGDEDG